MIIIPRLLLYSLHHNDLHCSSSNYHCSRTECWFIVHSCLRITLISLHLTRSMEQTVATRTITRFLANCNWSPFVPTEHLWSLTQNRKKPAAQESDPRKLCQYFRFVWWSRLKISSTWCFHLHSLPTQKNLWADLITTYYLTLVLYHYLLVLTLTSSFLSLQGRQKK